MRSLIRAIGVLLAVMGLQLLTPTLAHAADIRTVAVLPLASVEGNTVPGAIAGGLHTNVANELAKDPRFKVAESAKVDKYFDKEFDPIAVGKELGVAIIFVGSIDGDEQTSHVKAQLIEVASGKVLFKGDFFSDPMNVDQYHVEVATSIKLALDKAGL